MIKKIILPVFAFAALSTMAQNQPTFYLRGLLDMWKKGAATTETRIAKYNALFPEAIRANIVYPLAVNSAWYYTKVPSVYTAFVDDSYLNLCKRVDSTGIAFIVNVGEIGNYPNAMPATTAGFISGVGTYYLTPEQVDNIFANTKNCLGLESGENFWTYNPTTVNSLLDMLRVCKKYNKKYIVGEGGWAYSSYVRFFNENYTVLKNEELGKYLIPTFKNTKPYGALATQSVILGAWVTGLTANYGTWNDEWAWTYSSFKNANEFPIYTKADNTYNFIPYTHYLKSWLLTIAMGGNTAFMESMTFNRDATPIANISPYLAPFIKGLAEHNIMPSRDAVLAKIKAIANPYGTYTLSDGTTADYHPTNLISYQTTVVPYKPTSLSTYAEPFGLLYKNTYGIWNDTAYTNMGTVTDRYFSAVKSSVGKNALLNAVVREVLPNNARYLTIPLLPHSNAVNSVPAGIETVALNTLVTDEAVKNKFESLYPATPNENGAWAQEIDNSFFVINSHENADIDQNFTFTLGNSNIETLSGIMPFQNLLFGKREGVDKYWFQSTGYAVANGTTSGQKYSCNIKKTKLTFKCKFEPKVRIEDAKSSFVQKIWDAETKILTLNIDHAGGAVNFYIVSNSVDKPYFVRAVGDSVSWKAQALVVPESVININNVSELSKYLGSSTYYFAKGEYLAEQAGLNDGMSVYGGFRGDEAVIDPEQRERADLDNNGQVEPWELKNQTIFRGNAAYKNSMATRSVVVDENSLLDGVIFKNLIGTGENGLITVGSPHAVGATVTTTKGTLRNSIIDGVKSTFGRGIIMITGGSEVSGCLLQNDTISSGFGGGMVYLATSGGVLKNSVIRNCLANGQTSRGGALCADIPKGNQTNEFLIQNCLIYNNKADYAPVLRQDAYGVSGTPETTLGCQFVNCTLFNNQAVSSTALIDVNAVSSKIVNTLVYSAQHDAFRVLYGGLMTATNCLTNKAITTGAPTSSGNVVETVLANYKFKQAFTKTHTFIDKKSADYASLIGASYVIENNSSVAVTNKGIESLASFIPTGTANIIPTMDMYNFARPTGAYTLGAFQLGTQTGFYSGFQLVKAATLKLYPNPANDIIYFQHDADATVYFYNIAGVLVKTSILSATANSVNIASLPAGSYIVKATALGQVKSALLVKNK